MPSQDSVRASAWFDLSTPDVERAKRFYAEMFGWEVEEVNDDYGLVGGGDGAPIGGIGKAGPHSPYVGLTPYFPTADVEAALDRAEQLEGARVFGPVVTPMGTIGAFEDPDGNTVGLISL